jgi:two-component sensor histidine kinase
MEGVNTLGDKAAAAARRIDLSNAMRPPSAARRLLSKQQLHKQLESQKRTFDLAMAASDMGTWRYTFADNICHYDENAQRLYGLTETRFLHDADGVRSKFHPDDLDSMWANVAAAIHPRGDGRYSVEYRVKQLDGSWRWLSAWGQVEFDGDGPDRQPIAISGASRDLSERKEAEARHQLLLNELEHRVKNTLATIHAITVHTLGAASDLPSAKEALEQRIVSMGKAHDLLIAGSWTGASLKDIITRVLEAFSPNQVDTSGPDVEISSTQTLALSMALHELATNATKYGALSCLDGRVMVSWELRGHTLHLDWVESGGPVIRPPSRKGFGSLFLSAFSPAIWAEASERILKAVGSDAALSPSFSKRLLPPDGVAGQSALDASNQLSGFIAAASAPVTQRPLRHAKPPAQSSVAWHTRLHNPSTAPHLRRPQSSVAPAVFADSVSLLQ